MVCLLVIQNQAFMTKANLDCHPPINVMPKEFNPSAGFVFDFSKIHLFALSR
jgi:hypothetical protein